jgi:hypothetical protein
LNTANPQLLFREGREGEEKRAPLWQDKLRFSTLNTASAQPLRADKTALKEKAIRNQPQAFKNSEKPRSKLAAGWVDLDTDAIIEQRKRGLKVTRSKMIAIMLKEAAQNDAFNRNQAILAPIIRETMRAEFQLFTNRFLTPISRITYKVGYIFELLSGFVAIYLDAKTFHRLDEESEASTRKNITRRTPQMDEAREKMRQSLEGNN